ncbi:MAG: protein-disulfide reductase DsbD domain-containing protein [Devosia sp.]
MRTLLAIALLLATAPAYAAATPWQDVASGARLRLISSDVRQPDGTTLVGIELDIPDSYKTYWRLPGESGIPTEFDISGSAGVTAPAIEWPFPTPEVSGGFLDYVYHGATVLPVAVKATGDTPLLKANVTMGVCSDVCVPVRASFSLPLSFAAADAGQSIRLKQAEALAPIPWNEQEKPFGGLSYDNAAHALHIELADPAIDPASVIVSTPDPTVVFDRPQKSPDGHSILLPMRDIKLGSGWAGKPVQLTFMTTMGSFEVSEPVALRP